MKPADPRILTINGGSSSIKFALFEAADSLRRILDGGIERPEATLKVKGSEKADDFSRLVAAPNHTVAVGATPGQNFIYVHLNRVSKKYDLDMIYVSGPGHGGPAVVSNTYLEGTYSEIYPNISQDETGLRKLFVQFSFPGGIPSHASPECPGSIHEGGELGYSLSHSFGAVFDNPNLVVACVVGDGEAETGPLATAWHSNKFLDPITDGAVLPILHLNGYKISNPTVLARIEREELEQFLRGCGWTPHFVEGDEPQLMHEAMAATLDTAVEQIKKIQRDARDSGHSGGNFARPRWPMIVLNSPKGWTGPKVVDGLQIEGTFRAHQVPLSDPATHPEHLKLLEEWLMSYRPQELCALHESRRRVIQRSRRHRGTGPASTTFEGRGKSLTRCFRCSYL